MPVKGQAKRLQLSQKPSNLPHETSFKITYFLHLESIGGNLMPLKIYNSLTKREEEFKPIEDGHVKMYNCGPTVYDYFHIGNARNFVTAETVCRYLEYKGYKVTFVQNVTDVEDKIINKANELGVPPSEVAQKFTEAYFEDLEKLRTRMPDKSPKATEHIGAFIRHPGSELF